jgi:hypothetical protein
VQSQNDILCFTEKYYIFVFTWYTYRNHNAGIIASRAIHMLLNFLAADCFMSIPLGPEANSEKHQWQPIWFLHHKMSFPITYMHLLTASCTIFHHTTFPTIFEFRSVSLHSVTVATMSRLCPGNSKCRIDLFVSWFLGELLLGCYHHFPWRSDLIWLRFKSQLRWDR